MLLVVVYVGAVAVLFLFVVMMLDVDFTELRQGFLAISAGRRADRRRAARRAADRAVGAGPSRPRWRAPSRRRSPIRTRFRIPRRSGNCSTRATSSCFQAAGLVLLVADDRRHRADAAPQDQRQAPGRRRPGQPVADGRAARHQARPGRLRGTEPASWKSVFPLSRGRGDPVHDRRVRHFPEPQERHHHPDVGRADPARRQHLNFVAFSSFLGDLVGQIFALFVLSPSRRPRRRSASRSSSSTSATAPRSQWKTSI